MVARVEVRLHRRHEVHRGDEDGEKRAQRRHVVDGRSSKQPLHLHTHWTVVHDDEMGEQAQVHEDAREHQHAKPLEPCKKQQATALALGKILNEPSIVERHEQAV